MFRNTFALAALTLAACTNNMVPGDDAKECPDPGTTVITVPVTETDTITVTETVTDTTTVTTTVTDTVTWVEDCSEEEGQIRFLESYIDDLEWELGWAGHRMVHFEFDPTSPDGGHPYGAEGVRVQCFTAHNLDTVSVDWRPGIRFTRIIDVSEMHTDDPLFTFGIHRLVDASSGEEIGDPRGTAGVGFIAQNFGTVKLEPGEGRRFCWTMSHYGGAGYLHQEFALDDQLLTTADGTPVPDPYVDITGSAWSSYNFGIVE